MTKEWTNDKNKTKMTPQSKALRCVKELAGNTERTPYKEYFNPSLCKMSKPKQNCLPMLSFFHFHVGLNSSSEFLEIPTVSFESLKSPPVEAHREVKLDFLVMLCKRRAELDWNLHISTYSCSPLVQEFIEMSISLRSRDSRNGLGTLLHFYVVSLETLLGRSQAF